MRRRNNIWPIWLLFLFIFPGVGFGGFALILPLIITLLGVLFFAGIFGMIFKENKQNKNIEETYSKPNNNPYSRAYPRNNRTSSFISAKDRELIDRCLSAYFRQNYALPLYEDLALVTKNGNYSQLAELYLAKDGEVIISLAEFKESYPGSYNEILSLLKELTKQNSEVLKAEVKKPDIKKSEKLSDAEKYITKINDLNIAIEQAEITNGLYQTCSLLKQIDSSLKGNPQIPKIEKLYDYYLPILVKILEKYKDLADIDMRSKEFKETEAQLIKTIILINEALKNIFETLHEGDYMDLTADMTTLQSLLKKDGLVKEGSLHAGVKDD